MVEVILKRMCEDLQAYFVAHGFPGFSVAAGWRGRIIYTNAHGHADLESQRAMSVNTPIRLGSLSKVFATAAILKLKQDNRLDLHDPLEKYFPRCPAVGNKPTDPAVLKVTLKQILNHTAGFPSDTGRLPYMEADESLDFYLRPENLSYETICRYVYSCKLLHAPGSKPGYSTVGYLILGRIIELISGKPYPAFLKNAILEPAGVSGVMFGSTSADARSPGEATYYNVHPLDGGTTRRETEFKMGRCRYLECRDSSGGLVASAVSLVDAMMRFYDVTGSDLFTVDMRRDLVGHPEGIADAATEQYNGLGWWIRRVPGFEEERAADPLYMIKLGHTGRTSGAVNLLFRGENGVWAAVQANAGVSQDDWLTLQWAIYHMVAPRIRSLNIARLQIAHLDPAATCPDKSAPGTRVTEVAGTQHCACTLS